MVQADLGSDGRQQHGLDNDNDDGSGRDAGRLNASRKPPPGGFFIEMRAADARGPLGADYASRSVAK